MKEIIKNTWSNFKVPIILGTCMFIGITAMIGDFDETDIHWYYILISIATAGTVGAIAYAVKKYFTTPKGSSLDDCEDCD